MTEHGSSSDWHPEGAAPGPAFLALVKRGARSGGSVPTVTVHTRSPFGGLWTDRVDGDDQLRDRLRTGRVSSDLVPALTGWIADGYVILPGAADPALCERFAGELALVWREGHPEQVVVDSRTGAARRLEAGDETRLTRAVDAHVHFASAQQLLRSARVTEFLRVLFDADPLYFQSLVFETGSEQGLHQDTAFVVVDRPLELVGVWFALEDARPGSGELQYAPGSHRLADHCFAPGRRHFDPSIDGHDAHVSYYPSIASRCDDAGLSVARFLPRKGDVLLWSADLVHGGAPITDPTLTRRSLVAHACPLDSPDRPAARPHFFSFLPGNLTTKALPDSGARYASQYHVLSPDDESGVVSSR